MPAAKRRPVALSAPQARRIWLRAQRLDSRAPFGAGPEATRAAVEHLGYVQIDTINVIERCHHHLLYSRIPDYARADLHRAQSQDKTVFEYWTHALSYVPTRDLRFFLPAMKAYAKAPAPWFAKVTKPELRKVLTLLRNNGAVVGLLVEVERDAQELAHAVRGLGADEHDRDVVELLELLAALGRERGRDDRPDRGDDQRPLGDAEDL